jgi:hypothetical protein
VPHPLTDTKASTLLEGKTCTKCGQWKPLDAFYVRRKDRPLSRHSDCKECANARAVARRKERGYPDRDRQREHWRNYYHRHPDRAAARRQKKRRARADWFQELKATLVCAQCGESDAACLDFHHRDGEEKTCAVADLVRNEASEERILAEIGRCVVLCANCHRKLHAGRFQLPLSSAPRSTPARPAAPGGISRPSARRDSRAPSAPPPAGTT